MQCWGARRVCLLAYQMPRYHNVRRSAGGGMRWVRPGRLRRSGEDSEAVGKERIIPPWRPR